MLKTTPTVVRHAAAAYIMLRESAEDTVLNIPNPVGEEGSTPLTVHKGTAVRFHLPQEHDMTVSSRSHLI